MRFVPLSLLVGLVLSAGVANAIPDNLSYGGNLRNTPEQNGLRISLSSQDIPAPSIGLLEDAAKGSSVDRLIALSERSPHLNVVLQNTSDKPIRVFDEGNSWGYGNLTLEVTAVDGKVFKEPLLVRPGPKIWLANAPTVQVIAPGEAIVREVALQVPAQVRDPGAPVTEADLNPRADLYWEFPVPTRLVSIQVHMRAVFSIGDSGDSRYSGRVWTGRIATPDRDYRVFWGAR